MKYFLFILFSFVLLKPETTYAQNFPEKYRSIFIGFGPRSLSTQPGIITTSYIDESPSMDKIETSVMIKDKYNKLGINLGYKWGKYSGLSHALLIDISLGEHQGGLFTYSLGYNFPFELNKSALIIRPAFMLGFGNFGFDIGQLDNNAGYIQINDVKYFDRKLDVSLSSQVFVYGPEVNFMYMLNEHFDVFFNINYDLSNSNNRPKIKFKPTSDNEDTPNETSLSIDGDNPLVKYNENKITSLPYDISGLRISVGVSYVWNIY